MSASDIAAYPLTPDATRTSRCNVSGLKGSSVNSKTVLWATATPLQGRGTQYVLMSSKQTDLHHNYSLSIVFPEQVTCTADPNFVFPSHPHDLLKNPGTLPLPPSFFPPLHNPYSFPPYNIYHPSRAFDASPFIHLHRHLSYIHRYQLLCKSESVRVVQAIRVGQVSSGYMRPLSP